MLLTSLGRSQRDGRQQKRPKPTRHMHRKQALHPNRISTHRNLLDRLALAIAIALVLVLVFALVCFPSSS
jgi:hypothetical protein